MSTGVSTLSPRHRAANFCEQYLIPLGWLVVLTSMFIAGDRNRVHQLFYVFLALPTFALLTLRPDKIKILANNTLFKVFVVFSIYTIVSVAWSSTDESALSLSRRPLYLALLFFSAGLIASSSPGRLEKLTWISGVVAALAAMVTLYYFLNVRLPLGDPRLNGYGALYNPLLSAHVFGAFATYWLATWIHGKNLFNPLALVSLLALSATLIGTGSRTPFVGMAAALIWLLATGDKHRGRLIVATIVIGLTAAFFVHPDAFTQRGMSYRPQIWMESLRQIGLHPWFGYGYDAEMTVVIPGADQILADPHNMELGVLYSGGIVGLGLWIALYFVALRFCWKNHHVPAVNLAAAWLIFGLGSGLTEGMAFMSRPKEHWFLIWIPFAMIYAQWVGKPGRSICDTKI